MRTQQHTQIIHFFFFLFFFVILSAFCLDSFMPVPKAEAAFDNFSEDYWSKTFDPTLCKCTWARNPYTGLLTSSCQCRPESERDRFFYYNYVPAVTIETRSESCSCGSCGTRTCTRIYKYVYEPETDRFVFLFHPLDDPSLEGSTEPPAMEAFQLFRVTIKAWDDATDRVVEDRVEGDRLIAGYGSTCDLYIVNQDGQEHYVAELIFDPYMDNGVKVLDLSAHSSSFHLKIVDRNRTSLTTVSAEIPVPETMVRLRSDEPVHVYPQSLFNPVYESPPSEGSRKVLVLVDDFMYNDNHHDIVASIEQYVSDLEAENSEVTLFRSYTYNIADLRDFLQCNYNEHQIEGVILIGGVLVHNSICRYIIPATDSEPERTVFNDLYFTDLDGTWEQIDPSLWYEGLTGFFNQHLPGNGDLGPEIWLSRISAYPISIDENTAYHADVESQYLKNYFARNHAYRTAMPSVSHQGLSFIDDDDRTSTPKTYCLSKAYPNHAEIIDDNIKTNRFSYLNYVADDYEWIHLNVHGDRTAHLFKMILQAGPDLLHDCGSGDPNDPNGSVVWGCSISASSVPCLMCYSPFTTDLPIGQELTPAFTLCRDIGVVSPSSAVVELSVCDATNVIPLRSEYLYSWQVSVREYSEITLPAFTPQNNAPISFRTRFLNNSSLYQSRVELKDNKDGKVTIDDLSTKNIKPLFFTLHSCFGAYYTGKTAVCNQYLFGSSNTLAILGFSNTVRSTLRYEYNEFYESLGPTNRQCIGQSFLDWMNSGIFDLSDPDDVAGFHGATLLGDVTLTLDPPIAVIQEAAFEEDGMVLSCSGSGSLRDTQNNCITAYEWRSNIDGLLSDQAAFSQTGLTHGLHTISLRVKDQKGRWSTAAKTQVAINRSPTAHILVVKGIDTFNTITYNFHSWGSSDPDGDQLTYSWTIFPFTFSGDYTSFIYMKGLTGTYQTVSLTVTDSYGSSDTTGTSVWVPVVGEYCE